MNDFDPEFDKLTDLPPTIIGGDKSAAAWHPNSGPEGSDIADRFWAKVDKSADCWIWTAATSKNDGYGRFAISGMRLAHRVSWEMAYGAIPDGLVLDHMCFVRRCVNPDHLRLVTRKQNNEHLQGAQRNSKSGIRGVRYDAKSGGWRAHVSHFGRQISLGMFSASKDAEKAVIAKRAELFTHDDAADSTRREAK